MTQRLNLAFLVLASLIVVIGAVSEAGAVRFYQDQLFSKYPKAATSLAGCIACHVNGTPPALTPFGQDFKSLGYTLSSALEARDSDHDGFTNLAELTNSPAATNPGDAASKPAAAPVNGACGSANGTTVSTAPTTNLCSAGTASAVSGSGPWTWTCAGSSGGTSASCSAALAKLSQTITFGKAPSSLKVGASTTVSATASSGLPVTFRSRTTTLCTLSGSTVTAVAAGSCKIGANQAGDSKYSAAPEATLTIEIEAEAPTVPNYQGLWWKAPASSEAGWGINFAHQGDIVFATWFTYDAKGKPWWLVGTLDKTGAGVYTGTLYSVTGPSFAASPWTGPVVETPVGSMTVTFTDLNNGELSWIVNGVQRTKTITRQLFGTPPVCTWGKLSDLSLATNYQDLWWSAPPGSESGWGINLTHQGDTVFATWFTYDESGKPWWLIATLGKVVSGVYTGTVASVTGPAFDAELWTGPVTETPVGTATLTFANGNSATLSATIGNVKLTKQITRQVFVAPGTSCD